MTYLCGSHVFGQHKGALETPVPFRSLLLPKHFSRGLGLSMLALRLAPPGLVCGFVGIFLGRGDEGTDPRIDLGNTDSFSG